MRKTTMTPADRTETMQRLIRADTRTRAEVAEALGVSRWTVRSWMEGSRTPPEMAVRLMRRIARVRRD
jgi:DNA-binding transcriptional regulator YiaG